MKVAAVLASFCSMLLLLFRKQFVWCFSLDETLETMLLEVIPYITICQPFLAIGFTAMDLNDSLHLYKRAMVGNALVTVFVMVPIGYVMTYVLHYNIEGLASAQCIGYTVAGAVNIMFFMTADWEKAVRKANDIAVMDDGCINYDEYGWEDLPDDAKGAATVLGYTKDTWGNKKGSDLDVVLLNGEQKAAANLMGYTKNTRNAHHIMQGPGGSEVVAQKFSPVAKMMEPSMSTVISDDKQHSVQLYILPKPSSYDTGYRQYGITHDVGRARSLDLDYGHKKKKKKGIFGGMSSFKKKRGDPHRKEER
jgi:hypothetical protein